MYKSVKDMRKAIAEELADTEKPHTLPQFEALVAEYHQLGIQIYREAQAEAIRQSSVMLPIVTDIYWPANNGNQHLASTK
jgi:hypothetical protein